jgi:Na+/H+ antiporter NhaD/arsenite permease-like protein
MEIEPLLVVAVFVVVYVGIAFGRWPALRIDRTGIALVGGIVLLIFDGASSAPLRHVDFATLAVLFGLMVLSAQFGAAGFYSWCAQRIAGSALPSPRLLAVVVVVTGILSSILANDIVVFAMTPILCEGLVAGGRDPRPYLIAHAGAANVGSAATLIGNPQNILIGEHAGLGFWHYAGVALPVVAVSLVVVHLAVGLTWRRQLRQTALPTQRDTRSRGGAGLDRVMLAKGLVATIALLVLFATDLPRWQGVLLVAGALLISRRLSTRDMLATIDWHLLVLFTGLFIVTGAFADTGLPAQAVGALERSGVALDDPTVIGAVSLAGSNTVGNVPLVMLVLAAAPDLSRPALYALAMLSTFAGNLLIVGSFANIIMVERAGTAGVGLSLLDHARTGIPMTLFTMAFAMLWLELLAA